MDPDIRAYRARVEDVPALLRALAVAKGSAQAQLLRADRVYGRDHLLHAARLARRAFDEARARSADLATETLVYAAGERQVGRAIEFLGLRPGVEGIAALAWGPDAEAALDCLAHAQGWTREDALLDGGPAVLDAFSVTPEERALLPPARWDELVLERVALADVLKA